MKRYLETNCVEFKRSWRDEWLKWICAFANSEGGILYIGIDEKKREVVGVADPQRLLEDVPLFRKHSSEARNELIAGALYRGGFVETWGRGIEKVCRECEKFGVPRPEYEATESDVMVCLKARVTTSVPNQELSPTPHDTPQESPHATTQETTQETTIETTLENLAPIERQIVALIISDATISRKSMAEKVGITADGVKYHLNALKNRHVLHHEGPTKKGRWVIDCAKKGGVR